MGLIFADSKRDVGTTRWWVGLVWSSVLDELSLISLLEIQVVLSSRELDSGTQRRALGQRGGCAHGLWIITSRGLRGWPVWGAGLLVG